MARCAAIKADGTRCKAQAMSGYDQCYYHSSEVADRRSANNSKGGKRGGRGRPVAELARIQARLEELAESVLAGEVERSDGAVAGQLLNYAVGAIRVGLKARELDELEQRISQLEEAAREKQGGTRWGA